MLEPSSTPSAIKRKMRPPTERAEVVAIVESTRADIVV
jgi:hypothetical protein